MVIEFCGCANVVCFSVVSCVIEPFIVVIWLRKLRHNHRIGGGNPFPDISLYEQKKGETLSSPQLLA